MPDLVVLVARNTAAVSGVGFVLSSAMLMLLSSINILDHSGFRKEGGDRAAFWANGRQGMMSRRKRGWDYRDIAQ